jgi:hypothetical protein
MDLIKELARSVVERDYWTNKQKIDELLRMDCKMYTNLGTDSTQEERIQTRNMSKVLYEAIKQIDNNIGDELLRAIDC